MRETSQEFPDEQQRLAVCFRQWRSSRQRGAALGWNHLLGVWAIAPDFVAPLQMQIEGFLHEGYRAEPVIEARAQPDDLIAMSAGGTAIIPLHGPIMKHDTLLGQLFGMTSIRAVQQALSQALAAEDVRRILFHVESPGGHVAGIHAFAEAVRQARRVKPVAAHIDDLGASAAYWAIAHADRITANAPAEIGSLRTMAITVDSSKNAIQRGYAVHVVTRAAYKGIGVEGTTLAPEHLAYIQDRVDYQDQFFLSAVRGGRQLDEGQLAAVTDGRVWGATEAKALRLIDEVRSYERALQDFERMTTTGSRPTEVRERISQRRAALNALEEVRDHATDHG
jgi:signal peptide peptidase SppA